MSDVRLPCGLVRHGPYAGVRLELEIFETLDISYFFGPKSVYVLDLYVQAHHLRPSEAPERDKLSGPTQLPIPYSFPEVGTLDFLFTAVCSLPHTPGNPLS